MLCGGKVCAISDEPPTAARCRSSRTCRRRRLDPSMLGDLPLFDGLGEERIMNLLAGAAVEMHPPRAMLFDAGSPADAFFILLSGRVKLMAISPEGKESIVEIVEPVSSFAEAAMFASGRYPVSAETLEEADLIRVRASAFMGALREDQELAQRMLAALYRWNRQLSRERKALKAQNPAQRVAWFLLSLASDLDGGDSPGGVTVALPYKKSVIASRLGMEPESLSRVFARLREHGVDARGKGVAIADMSRLRRFCAAAGEGVRA
jgi:CRP/FNR family transcriptional regulator, dissimilatory nitrate respiration regulator